MRHVPPLSRFAVAAALFLAACGDATAPSTAATGDRETATKTPASEAPAAEPARGGGLAFVDGFAAGARKASSPDEVLLVYVGRHRPT